MGDLNKQLQELQARVTQAEKSIAAHHQGISFMVDALLKNPLTSDVGAVGKIFYNHAAGTFQILIGLIGDKLYDAYKSITDIKAKAIVEAAGKAVEQTIDQIAKQIESAIADQVKKLVEILDSYIKQLDDLTKQIEDLGKQISEEADANKKAELVDKQKAAEQERLTALSNLESAQKAIQSVLSQSGKSVTATVASFVKSQQDMAKGKSQSLDLTTGG